MKLPHFLRALSSRNYRIFFAGQSVSLVGNWMTGTASVWLVYHLSNDPFQVGLVGFANLIPVLLFAPFAGVGVDRHDALRLAWLTQALSMLQSSALAVLTLTGHATVSRIIMLCLCQGCINALDWPVRQALIFRIAGDRTLLENVIALNSLTFNSARMIGPAIAGFVIAAWGPGTCFAVDAVTFLAVLGSLALLQLTPPIPRLSTAHPLADLREGVRYAWSHAPILRVLLVVPVIGLAGFAHSILAPIFARDVYLGDARTLGFLLSATGAGSILAGLFLSTRPPGTDTGRFITWGAVVGGSGLVAIAFARTLPVALGCFAAAGLGSVLVMVAANTFVQTNVEDAKRGRVMSLFIMGQSLFPIGSLLVGAAAAAFSAQAAIIVAGLVCLAGAAGFARSRARLLS